jgi:hypothetical protein
MEPVALDGKGDKLNDSKKPVFLVFRTKDQGAHGNLGCVLKQCTAPKILCPKEVGTDGATTP